jgi:hypothetical protein
MKELKCDDQLNSHNHNHSLSMASTKLNSTLHLKHNSYKILPGSINE